ncbi:MAG: MBL fold metallo-hydrolase [Clostridia bacterium]
MNCTCDVCTDKNMLNRRTRPSVLITYGKQTALIDVSPDFKQQYLSHHNHGIIPDTVLFTHAHNDHIAGLGDFADLCLWNQIQSKLVASPDIIAQLENRYPYLKNRDTLTFIGCQQFSLGQWHVQFVKVNHGHNGYSYGLIFSNEHDSWAYVSDAFDMTDEQLHAFRNLDTLILGTSYWNEEAPRNRRSVYSVVEAMQVKEMLKPKRMVLTHLSHDIQAEAMSRQLPGDVRFAFDGMELGALFAYCGVSYT